MNPILRVVAIVTFTMWGQALHGASPMPELEYAGNLEVPIRADSFQQPRCVVADLVANEVFVCDTFGNRLVIFDQHSLLEFIIPGGDLFRSPIDVAADPDGYLFLLGFFGGRRSFTLLDFDGEYLQKIDLIGLPEETEKPELISIAIDPQGQRLYSVDNSHHRLWITDRNGTIIDQVNFEEDRTEEEIQDLILAGVDVYGDTVLVAVPSDGYVHIFDLDGKKAGLVGEKGTGPCQSAFPIAAALDEEGMIWVLDKQRALVTRWDPVSNRCLGERLFFGGVPGSLYQPDDLALDREGRLYISQGFEGWVQIFEGAVPAADSRNLDGSP